MSHSITLENPSANIAVVTFCDPPRHNQLCWAAVDELAATLRDCRERGSQVVILASSLPDHWLEHAWLRDLAHGLEGREQTGSGSGWFEVQTELEHPDMISIAAIAGDCSGGGAELGWACDLRIAERQARFRQPEVDMGLTTGIGGCSRLRRLAGRSVALQMVLTGQPLSAERLHALGVVNALVDAGEALPAAIHWAELICAKSARALCALKALLNDTESMPLDEALRHEQAVFQRVAADEQTLARVNEVQAAYDAGASADDVAGYRD